MNAYKSECPSVMTTKKRFGQNFLVDKAMVERLVRSIQPQAYQAFVEIGPGQGVLTRALLPHIKQLDAIEIDRDLVPDLQQSFAKASNCKIHQADALTFDFDSLSGPRRLVGNLPYNISTPILFHCVGYAHCWHDMHLMLQREVVERACAKPGSKVYGRLSVMLQYYAKVESLIPVPPDCFRPKPQVHSAWMRVIPYTQKPWPAQDETCLAQVVRQAFNQRRKTLRAIFKRQLNDRDWAAIAIDPQQRPECLDVPAFVALSNYILQTSSK